MSKYFVLVAALMVLAVACNKKETATETAPTVEQSAPAETDAAPVDGAMEDGAMEATEGEEAHH